MCCRVGPPPSRGRGTGAVLRGRARRAAVPTQRWPGPSRHFPASPRPAPPRPAGTQSSSPHRQSDPPASLPASSSSPPPRSLSKFTPGPGRAAEANHGCLPRDAAPREVVCREPGGAGAPDAALSTSAELKVAGCPRSQVPRAALRKKRGLGSPEKGTWEFYPAWQGLTPLWVALMHTTLPPRQREKLPAWGLGLLLVATRVPG